jgi:AraC-like DNA-binding protein
MVPLFPRFALKIKYPRLRELGINPNNRLGDVFRPRHPLRPRRLALRYALYSLPEIKGDNCGNAILSPGWSHPERLLPSSVLILGRKGSALIDDEGELLEVRPSRVVLLAAGRHHKGAERIAASASYFWIHFTATSGSPSMLTEQEAGTILSSPHIRGHKLEEAALVPQIFDLKDEEPFVQAFHELLFEQESPSYTPLKYQALFRQLLIRLTECVIASSEGSPGARDDGGSPIASIVYTIIAEVLENLIDPELSVKSIAARLRLNPDYVGRRFKEVMGISIGSYVLKKRIQFAQGRLEESNDSVKEIARQCGFGTMRHFIRQFKSEAGMTPTEARLHYQARHINNQ